MDPIWLVIAFILGLAARHVGLPPMIGFLIAGFVLNAAGIEGGELIEEVADLGVTLLLFTIGLKLRVETLLRPQVWAVASGHMILTVLIFGSGIYALAVSGAALFAELDLMLALLIAFALSFSSTVFAVKVLEEKGEMAALHGRIAIGILIMQDIFAVVFLALSTGKIPSLWAIALLALIPLRPLLTSIMARSGHGELLILYGILIAFGGAALFEAVGVKGDLGALIIGALLANHPKASELAKSLLGFKDLFLVGFFLNVGLSAALSFQAFGIAAILVLLVALKMSLFFVLLTRLQARARTSLLASLSLANYSEFGLIVAAIGVANGWITGDWLAIIAIALSVSFVLASPLNVAAHSIYAHYGEPLRRFETASRLPEEQPIKPGDAEVAIFGMGRVGVEAYDTIRARYGDIIIGVDADPYVVKQQKQAGRQVIHGDATDPDFWERAEPGQVNVVMLTIPSHAESLAVAKMLRETGYDGHVAAMARYTDEIAELKGAGADAAYDIYAEAGTGFAQHVAEQLRV